MPVKNPNLVLIIVYAMTQLRIFPLIFANALAAPGRNQELYSCLTRIEDELKQQAFDVFEALDQLKTPNAAIQAIQKLKSNINIEYLREIYSYARLDVRKIFRLHHLDPDLDLDLFDNLSDQEKCNLANKLAALGLDQKYWIAIIEQNIKDSDFLMALDQLTVPGDEHDVAIEVLCLNKRAWLRAIFPYLSEDVKKIMLSHPLVRCLLSDLLDPNNKSNSKQSRLSLRFS
ncbi:hypothetical protein [Roseiflexus sp.]